jgi:hypothetical protein
VKSAVYYFIVGRRIRWNSGLTGPCRRLELTMLRYLSAPFSALKTFFTASK